MDKSYSDRKRIENWGKNQNLTNFIVLSQWSLHWYIYNSYLKVSKRQFLGYRGVWLLTYKL